MGTRFYIDIEQAKARISEIGLTNAARELNIRPGTLANRVSNKTKNPEKRCMFILHCSTRSAGNRSCEAHLAPRTLRRL